MGWSGGTYTRERNWVNDDNAGTDMVAANFDEEHDSIATGINQCINKDGSNSNVKSTSTEVVINEDSGDVNFRVEGNNNANLLFCDAGNDRIGIGTSTPATLLHMLTAAPIITFDDSDATGTVTVGQATAAFNISVDPGAVDASSIFSVLVDGNNRINSGTSATIMNEDGGDFDFRVEGDTNANLLFCDAGNDRVGVGTASPSNLFHVQGAQQDPVRIEDTTDDTGIGPNLLLYRSRVGTPAAGDAISSVSFAGQDAANAINNYARISSVIRTATAGSEDGELQLQASVAGTLREFISMDATASAMEVVVNEGSLDIDFRVESNNNANMLFVDAGNDRVGIGVAAPQTTVEIYDNSAGATGPILAFHHDSASPAAGDDIGRINFFGNDSAGNQETYFSILCEIDDATTTSEDGKLSFFGVNGGGIGPVMYSNGNMTVGQGSAATSITTGFLYITGMAGTPVGTPVTQTGFVPLAVDTTNHKLYFYSGGSWRDAGP